MTAERIDEIAKRDTLLLYMDMYKNNLMRASDILKDCEENIAEQRKNENYEMCAAYKYVYQVFTRIHIAVHMKTIDVILNGN